MLGNVLDNACKWADAEVRLTITETEHSYLLAVEDDGPGIPKPSVIRSSAAVHAWMNRLMAMAWDWGSCAISPKCGAGCCSCRILNWAALKC